MLLPVLTVSLLITQSLGNPFHKYPFVFLLDIGNEELTNVKTEQLRITAPGGTVALKYPAVGNGDTIAHVRVSGLDFGTDLKANIVEGGPGYNYVVLMFVGNSGVSYDAVITVQTVPGTSNGYPTPAASENSNNNENGIYKVEENIQENNDDDDDEETKNNSAEEIDETDDILPPDTKVQASIDNIRYTDRNSQNYDNSNEETDEVKTNRDEYNLSENSFNNYDYAESSNVINNSPQEESQTSSEGDPKAEPYSVNNGYVSYDNENEEPVEPRGYVDSSVYDKFEALKPHIYDDVKVYPQTEQNVSDNNDATLDGEEDTAELDQMFNDDEVHEGQREEDSNNNYFDSELNNAVAY